MKTLCTCRKVVFSVRRGTHVTLGARDFCSAVSGFCQVFIANPREASAENFHRTREKPLVPRVHSRRWNDNVYIIKYLIHD